MIVSRILCKEVNIKLHILKESQSKTQDSIITHLIMLVDNIYEI